MKFCQSIDYEVINIFLWKYFKKWDREVTFFWSAFLKKKKKKLNEGIASGQYFLDKTLALVSPPHFMSVLSIVFLMLYSINWLNFIFWLLLLLEILSNMCIVIIVIICFPDYNVINFIIYFSFFIKPFFYMTKKSRTTF